MAAYWLWLPTGQRGGCSMLGFDIQMHHFGLRKKRRGVDIKIVDYWSKTFSVLVRKDFSHCISFLKEMMKPCEVPQLVNCDRSSLLCNVSNVLSSPFIFTAGGKITQHGDDGKTIPNQSLTTAVSSVWKSNSSVLSATLLKHRGAEIQCHSSLKQIINLRFFLFFFYVRACCRCQ